MVGQADQLARSEIALHAELCHPNVVSLLAAKETDDSFNLTLEYCNRAEYFERKICDVSPSTFLV